MNRREVKAERVATILDGLHEGVNRSQGVGAFVSPHEILGAITEGYHELIQRMEWGNDSLEDGLLSLATLCVFAAAGLQNEEEST